MRINEQIVIEDIRHTDLHIHTIYCDGKDTPEEMVCSAIEKGFSCIGFSGHSYVQFDSLAGLDEEKMQAYVQEINRLKRVYEGKIRIWCGVELDYHSLPEPGTDLYSTIKQRYRKDMDHIIGSVHYIPLHTPSIAAEAAEGQSAGYAAVDDTPEILMDAVRDYFNGDYYRAAEAYFQLAANVADRTGCDIIGHFDLFSKFNQKYQLFDERHPRYINAWRKAADQLITTNKVFEINTGAMSRGWRNVPYPAPEIQEYIRRKGGRFILSSDSHSKETIGYGFCGIVF